jgi:mono/diheme cytochrome c family protein
MMSMLPWSNPRAFAVCLRLWAASLILAASMAQGPAAAQDIRAGRALARDNCAECHAIGRSGRSPRPLATPFRLIPQRYPVEALEEAFGEGITGSHRGMPDFQFSPRQVDDLLGYIRSLARR